MRWRFLTKHHERRVKGQDRTIQVVGSHERILEVTHERRAFTIRRSRGDKGLYRVKGSEEFETRREGMVKWFLALGTDVLIADLILDGFEQRPQATVHAVEDVSDDGSWRL